MTEKKRSGFNPTDHMMTLKGKDYLPVAPRIGWFREDYPEGIIEVEHVSITDDHAIFRCTVTAIKDGEVKGRATDYGSESKRDFGDFIEKASTKATGRALAALGYGTLMAPELDELPRIVDTPQQRAPQAAQRPRSGPKPSNPTNAPPPANIDRERANKRLHAVGNKHGINHDGIRALVLAKAMKEGLHISSTNEAPGALLAATADAIEANPQELKAWADKQVAEQQELMPGPDEVPNPDRWTR